MGVHQGDAGGADLRAGPEAGLLDDGAAQEGRAREDVGLAERLDGGAVGRAERGRPRAAVRREQAAFARVGEERQVEQARLEHDQQRDLLDALVGEKLRDRGQRAGEVAAAEDVLDLPDLAVGADGADLGDVGRGRLRAAGVGEELLELAHRGADVRPHAAHERGEDGRGHRPAVLLERRGGALLDGAGGAAGGVDDAGAALLRHRGEAVEEDRVLGDAGAGDDERDAGGESVLAQLRAPVVERGSDVLGPGGAVGAGEGHAAEPDHGLGGEEARLEDRLAHLAQRGERVVDAVDRSRDARHLELVLAPAGRELVERLAGGLVDEERVRADDEHERRVRPFRRAAPRTLRRLCRHLGSSGG